MDEEFRLNDEYDWREGDINEEVMLSSGFIVYEHEIYFAVEKLTPYLQETENRYPNEEDIEIFIFMLRGP